jgi:hypothetical protein
MAGTGVIYVATQADRYMEEALLSAESVKRHAPGTPVTLFTDRPGHALAHTACFDAVEVLAKSDAGDARANAMMNRFTGLSRTPYERTLYLDTDARMMRAAPGMFDSLDSADVAMAEDVRGTSQALAHTGRRMFNCGVILYRRDRAALWLEPWENAARRNLALARKTPAPAIPEISAVEDATVRKWLLEIDKIALLSVLRPDGENPIRVAGLGKDWNCRTARADATTFIHHPHDREGDPRGEVLDLAMRWRAAGRADAGALFGYLGVVPAL